MLSIRRARRQKRDEYSMEIARGIYMGVSRKDTKIIRTGFQFLRIAEG